MYDEHYYESFFLTELTFCKGKTIESYYWSIKPDGKKKFGGLLGSATDQYVTSRPHVCDLYCLVVYPRIIGAMVIIRPSKLGLGYIALYNTNDQYQQNQSEFLMHIFSLSCTGTNVIRTTISNLWYVMVLAKVIPIIICTLKQNILHATWRIQYLKQKCMAWYEISDNLFFKGRFQVLKAFTLILKKGEFEMKISGKMIFEINQLVNVTANYGKIDLITIYKPSGNAFWAIFVWPRSLLIWVLDYHWQKTLLKLLNLHE